MSVYQGEEIKKAISILQHSKSKLRDGTAGGDGKCFTIHGAIRITAASDDSALAEKVIKSVSGKIERAGGLITLAATKGHKITHAAGMQRFRHQLVDSIMSDLMAFDYKTGGTI